MQLWIKQTHIAIYSFIYLLCLDHWHLFKTWEWNPLGICIWEFYIYINLALYFGEKESKGRQAQSLASCSVTHSSVTSRFSHCHGWDWCDLGPVLSYAQTALWVHPSCVPHTTEVDICPAQKPQMGSSSPPLCSCWDAVYSKQRLALTRTHSPCHITALWHLMPGSAQLSAQSTSLLLQ